MGFLRVSMSPAYGATFADAKTALEAITRLSSHHFLADDISADALPMLTSGKDVTDAHLVSLATAHGLKLATLDERLCAKSWAAGIAENPL